MALPHPDVNAVLRFPAKLGTSHKKAPQNLFKTPFAPSNFPPRRHTAAPHVFLRRAGRLCPPKHTSTAPALCPYPVIPSQCSHWRGNPFPAPAGAEHPRGRLSKGTFRACGRGVLLPTAAKVPKNAVQTCGLKIPYAPSPAAYHVKTNHANAVLCKFPLNLASSLLLFSLPLLL